MSLRIFNIFEGLFCSSVILKYKENSDIKWCIFHMKINRLIYTKNLIVIGCLFIQRDCPWLLDMWNRSRKSDLDNGFRSFVGLTLRYN